VQWFVPYLPYAVAMGALLGCSAFFSAAEAALFNLHRRDRLSFERGSRSQRAAATLLADPARLLTAVLFWNLVGNLAYFTLASLAAIEMHEREVSAWSIGVWSTATLLILIFFAEMLPKSLGVMQSRLLAGAVGLPLSLTVRAADPIAPLLRKVTLLSRRVFWPSFQPEPFLEVGDLERAVAMSTSDAALLEQEEVVLRNIVALSEYRLDELMRPRSQVRSFRPPIHLSHLRAAPPRGGYILVTEPDSEEVAGAIPLGSLAEVPERNLERLAEPVSYLPWCTSVAAALDGMQRTDRRVVVVVNELGEMIGVVTYEDVLDSIFRRAASRSQRLLDRQPIREVAPGTWHVTGLTSLRRLARFFGLDRKPGKTVTVAGLMQEMLGRLPEVGDECLWAGFKLRAIEIPERGRVIVELTRIPDEEAAEAEGDA
jgi:CBS domain containing-hemolysin-like protein